MVTGVKLARCPVRDKLEADPALVGEVDRMMDEYAPAYEDGHLLVSGGLSEQPARYVAFMNEIRRLRHVVEARYQAVRAEEGKDAETG